MSVRLTPEVEALIRQKVDSGQYASADEVIQSVIRMLDERDQRLQQLRAKLQVGLEQIEHGETFPFTPELVEQMTRDARPMAKVGRQSSPDVCP